MIYKHNGVEYRVPDGEILHLMQTMKISASEAALIYLEDNGKIINPEQEALCKKVENSGIMRTIHDASAKTAATPKTQRERTRKENPTKEKIISELAAFLPQLAENVTVVNPSKIIKFTVGNDTFTLDLIKNTKVKK